MQPGVDVHGNVNYASFLLDAQGIFAAQELSNSILALTLMDVVDKKR